MGQSKQRRTKCFNSTTVQLIRKVKDGEIDLETFQFHNGTINTHAFFKNKVERMVSIPQRYN